jgi:hypothetical protein
MNKKYTYIEIRKVRIRNAKDTYISFQTNVLIFPGKL